MAAAASRTRPRWHGRRKSSSLALHTAVWSGRHPMPSSLVWCPSPLGLSPWLSPFFPEDSFLLAPYCPPAARELVMPPSCKGLSLASTADECHCVDKGPSMSPLVCPNWRDSRKGPLSLTVPQGPWHQSWLYTRWTPPGPSSRFGSRTTACALASQEKSGCLSAQPAHGKESLRGG